MTAIVGGLRSRLVHDSVSAVVVEGLHALGWLEPNRRHSPITVVFEPRSWDEEVPPNTIAITTERASNEWLEVGSTLQRDEIAIYVDFFAESESLGTDVINDVRDILRGRIAGRRYATVDIYDFRQPTPAHGDYAAGFRNPEINVRW